MLQIITDIFIKLSRLFFTKMPTGLEARAAIDEKLKDALYKLRDSITFKELAKQLRSKGHKVSRKMFSKMIKADKTYNHYTAVPYDLYVELVGEEPEKVYWRESIHLARRIAHWHCYFFNVMKKELAIQVAEDANQRGLEYAVISMDLILFHDKRTSNINPVITDIVARRFNNAAGKPQFSSLGEIGQFVNYLDRNYGGEELSDRVSWDIAMPVVDSLIRLTGKSFAELVGYDLARKKLETGKRRLSLEKYLELQSELRETPQYKLVGLLMRLKNVLASTRLNLTLAELQLANKGKQNYGEKAFMEYILPAYIAVKQQHAFPIKCFEMIVNYPEKISSRYEGRLDLIAAAVGNEMLSYKEKILDRNMREGFNLGVTKDGINTALRDAMEYIGHYKKA